MEAYNGREFSRQGDPTRREVRRHRFLNDIGNIDFQMPVFPFVHALLFLLRSYPIEETILLLFRSWDLDISLRRRVDGSLSLSLSLSFTFNPSLSPQPRSLHRGCRALHGLDHQQSTLSSLSLAISISLSLHIPAFHKRDVERDELSSLPPPFMTTACLRSCSRYSTLSYTCRNSPG